MAATLRDHVWVIAAPVAATNLTDETVYVHNVRWVNPSGAGDAVQIANGRDGKVVWEAVAQVGANEQQESKVEFRLVQGFSIPLIDAGTLYIYGELLA